MVPLGYDLASDPSAGGQSARKVAARSVRSPRVAVCIATYQRPALLRKLLQSLASLDGSSTFDLTVIVVDNDAEESGRSTVEELCPSFSGALLYLVEPTRNISLARNAGVRLALLESPDFLAFIDDDEVASADWLEKLLTAQRRYGADVVAGAVLVRYPAGTPEWVRRGGFLEQPRHPSGAVLPYACTNNVLITRRLAEVGERPFDPAFGLSGGEDSHFFMRALRAGARVVWADEAVVEEYVPLSRATAGWILRRAFRIGNAGVWCERSLAAHPLWFAPRLAIASARVLHGLALLLPGAFRGRAGIVRALWKVSYGAGCLSAMVGVRYMEYQTVHRE
jgi:succinoglycan biosynthesis protein ExoM